MKQIEHVIASLVADDMNENGMKISESTMAAIYLNMTIGASQSSLEAVRDWFNGKNIALLPEDQQGKYVGAVVNLFTLIATNDTEGLVRNWILSDM